MAPISIPTGIATRAAMPRPSAQPRRVAHTVAQNSAVAASSASASRISVGGGNQRGGSHSNLAAISNTTSTTTTPPVPSTHPGIRAIGRSAAIILTPPSSTSPPLARRCGPLGCTLKRPGRGGGQWRASAPDPGRSECPWASWWSRWSPLVAATVGGTRRPPTAGAASGHRSRAATPPQEPVVI